MEGIFTLLLVIAAMFIVVLACVLLVITIVVIAKTNKTKLENITNEAAETEADNSTEAREAEAEPDAENTENNAAEAKCESDVKCECESCDGETAEAPNIVINNVNLNG